MQVAVEFQNEIIFTSFKAPETLFYRHVESLWLSLIPILKMVEERWYQQKQYFMKFLTSKKDFKKTNQQNPRYQIIAGFFRKEKFTLVQLAFTTNVSVPFVNFLTVFQSERPLLFTSAANKYYFSASHHEQENQKTTNQIKFLVVTIKQQIKLVCVNKY